MDGNWVVAAIGIGAVVVLGFIGFILFRLAVRIFPPALATAVGLFGWAAEQGFIGVAAYVACWIFLFPVMVAICIAGGIFGWLIDKEYEADARKQARLLERNSPRDEVERLRWEEEDRRYQEAKAALSQATQKSDRNSN